MYHTNVTGDENYWFFSCSSVTVTPPCTFSSFIWMKNFLLVFHWWKLSPGKVFFKFFTNYHKLSPGNLAKKALLPRSILHKILPSEYYEHINATIIKDISPVSYHPFSCVLVDEITFKVKNVCVIWRYFDLIHFFLVLRSTIFVLFDKKKVNTAACIKHSISK